MLHVVVWFKWYCLSCGANDALVHSQFSPPPRELQNFLKAGAWKRQCVIQDSFATPALAAMLLVKMSFAIHGIFSICAGISNPLFRLKFKTVLSGSTAFNQQIHSQNRNRSAGNQHRSLRYNKAHLIASWLADPSSWPPLWCVLSFFFFLEH